MLAVFDPECAVSFPPAALLHPVGRGSGSGIEMDETGAHVSTFSDEKVTRWRNFSDRSEALEAGLRD